MITHALTSNSGSLEGVGRLRLHYRSWEIPTPDAALLLIHGHGSHSGRYGECAERLAAEGFSTFALDLRGHGVSDGRRGHVPRFDTFLQDLDRFRREVQGLVDPRCPLILLGHGLGGLIALRYLEEFDAPLAGAVLTSPWLISAVAVPRWKATLAGALNRVLPAFPLAARIRPEHLSHDDVVVASYREDPLVHRTLTPRLFADASAAMGAVSQRADRIRVPLLVLIGGDDPVIDAERSAAFVRGLQGVDATIRILPGYLHDVLNEEDREPVLETLLAWAEGVRR